MQDTLRLVFATAAAAATVSASSCNAGSYSNSSSTPCQLCPTGSYSLSGANACTPCPTGFTQFDLSNGNSLASSCQTGCEAGYGGASCSLCPSGTYTFNVTMAASNVQGCTACPTGTTTADNGQPQSSCTHCSAGFEGSDCTACRAGWTSSKALKGIAACNTCTSDLACTSQGTCTNGNSCVCNSGFKGTFCDQFDSEASGVEIVATTVGYTMETGISWNDDYSNSESVAYKELEARIVAATTATFQGKAGYSLKEVIVKSFSAAERDQTGTRKRRNVNHVVWADVETVLEHQKESKSNAQITAFVQSTNAASQEYTARGFVPNTPKVTASTDSTVHSSSIAINSSILMVVLATVLSG